MNYDPSFIQSQERRFSDIPLGIDPAGRMIWNAEDLPHLAIPQMVVIARSIIIIDGWKFPVEPARKAFLIWLKKSSLRWMQDDPNERNTRWVVSMIESFADMIRDDQ